MNDSDERQFPVRVPLVNLVGRQGLFELGHPERLGQSPKTSNPPRKTSGIPFRSRASRTRLSRVTDHLIAEMLFQLGRNNMPLSLRLPENLVIFVMPRVEGKGCLGSRQMRLS